MTPSSLCNVAVCRTSALASCMLHLHPIGLATSCVLLAASTCIAQETKQPPAAQPPKDKIAAPTVESPKVDEARVMAFLRFLPTKRSGTGDAAHLQGLRDTEALIERSLKEAGYEPRMWPFVWKKGQHPLDPPPDESTMTDEEKKANTWHNIIAEVPGTTKPNEIIIIGAHFDAVTNSPGADDNGSGTAAVMEYARLFKDAKFDRTVRFVFFNLEEPGLIGSRKYAAAAKRAMNTTDKKVVAMVSIEMMGYYCDEPGCQKSPLPSIPGVFEAPNVGDFLGIATTKSHNWLGERIERAWLKAEPQFKLIRPDFIPDLPATPPDLLRSDHAPFLLVGIPAVIIADTANFRSPHYHQPTDTVETLDEKRYLAAVRGLAAAVPELAKADKPKKVKTSKPVEKVEQK